MVNSDTQIKQHIYVDDVVKYGRLIESYATKDDVLAHIPALDAGIDRLSSKLSRHLHFLSPLEYKFQNSKLNFSGYKSEISNIEFKKRIENAGVRSKDISQVIQILRNTDLLEHKGLLKIYSLRAILIEDDVELLGSSSRKDLYVLLKKPLYSNLYLFQ